MQAPAVYLHHEFSSCEFAKVERWLIDGEAVKWGDSNDDGVLAN